jgi:signal transduction histidine kinase
MNSRLARAVAVAICVLCVATSAASIPIGLAARARVQPGEIVIVGDPTSPEMRIARAELEREREAGGALEETTQDFNPAFAAVIVLLMTWLGVGLLIVWRQPRNWAGWLFLITGSPLPLLTLVQALTIYGTKADPGSVPLLGLWATLGEYLIYPIALLPLLFLLFPDGHPPSPRWRWAVRGLVGGTTLSVLAFLVAPGPFNAYLADGILYENPLGIDAFGGIAPPVILIGALVALGSALSTVVAVRQRFKRSTGEERQRMRWLAFVASFAGVCFVLQWVAGGIAEFFFRDEDAPIFALFFGLTAFSLLVGLPVAYSIAIFRHGLWDLDVVVKKTVQAGVLVAASVVVVAVVVLAIPVLFVGVDVDLAPALLTGVALAVGFHLVRSRARRVADRLIYGRRSSPSEVLSQFADRIGDELRPEVAWPADAPSASARPLAGGTLPELEGEAFEVRHQGDLLGALTIETPPDDPMDPAKERLARDMAAQAGLVLRNVALLEDIRESRRRIVAAQDERARALERNIHDGAQQQLVALAVKLRLAETMVERDPEGVRRTLAQLQEDATATLEDLRDLARGIYPPLLADRGLAAALEAQARRAPVPVTLHPDGVGRYAQDVESAVYFCCLEALNNVAKYAGASSVEVRLAHVDGELLFEVADDGAGFDPKATDHGTGLQGMADRLDAIEGTLEVSSAPGRGTRVRGRVPVEGVER